MTDAPREADPNCTDWCRDGGKSRGHIAVDPDQLEVMKGWLDLSGIPYERANGIADEDLPRAVDLLYRQGFPYHAIADLAKISHEKAFLVLTGNWHRSTE